MNNPARLDRSFDALAHPARRTIVARLARGPATVGEASRGLSLSKPAVTKHLKVLEQTGLVRRTVVGREHRLELRPAPLDEIESWIERQRALWEAKFDAVERHLADERKERGMTGTEQETMLRVTRRFDAPRERVFEAWTNADVLRSWWAAGPDWKTPTAEVDARPGGRYRLSMQDPSGSAHTVVGEYKEITPPERLAYTWSWEGGPPEMEGSADSLVVVEFLEDGDGTEVVLTHSGFANGEIRGEHEKGWTAVIENLARVLA